MNTPTLARRASGDESGIILPLVLVLLAIGLLVITPTLGHGYTALAGGTVNESRAKELHAADAGIEEGIHWLLLHKSEDGAWHPDGDGQWTRDSFVLNDNQVTVYIEALETNTYLITSVAMPLADGVSGVTTVLSRVVVTSGGVITDLEGLPTNKKWPGDLHLTSDGILGGGYHIDGSVFVDGSVTLQQGSRVYGGAVVSGDTTLEPGSRLDGVLCTSGSVTVTQGAQLEILYLQLRDEELATITLGTSGQGAAAKIDKVFIVANDFATVTIEVGNGTIGEIWATTPGNVTYTGTVNQWDMDSPPEPECPTFPKPQADVDVYEVQ